MSDTGGTTVCAFRPGPGPGKLDLLFTYSVIFEGTSEFVQPVEGIQSLVSGHPVRVASGSWGVWLVGPCTTTASAWSAFLWVWTPPG